jgi:hypothetical protein
MRHSVTPKMNLQEKTCTLFATPTGDAPMTFNCSSYWDMLRTDETELTKIKKADVRRAITNNGQ